jgi:hypothetical protein
MKMIDEKGQKFIVRFIAEVDKQIYISFRVD